MKGKYICIAKSYFDGVLKLGCEVAEKEIRVIQSLKSIESFINLNDEEIELLEKANDLLINKMDVLEDFIDDENNVFYNSDVVDEDEFDYE